MPALWNKTERTAKKLLKNGHASMKELLTLSYGEWPPKGLDINAAVPQSQDVIFKPFIKEALAHRPKKNTRLSRLRNALGLPWRIVKAELSVAGMATLARERVIWINKLMCVSLPRLAGRSSIVSTLGHEAVHSLQGDNYYRAAEIYGQQEAVRIWQAQRMPESDAVLNRLKDFDKGMHKNFLRRAFHAVARKVSCRPGLDYLKTGTETQAFFHEALAAGYKVWGELPQDKDDLWQALISLGMKPPADVRQHIENLPADAHACAFAKNVHSGEPARNLKAIDRSLSDAGREVLWHETLPALYSDLIEMYGDRKGRERFGFGSNTKGQMQARVFGAGL